MREVQVTGRIYDVTRREYTKRDGTKGPMTVLRFNVSEKTKQGDSYEWETIAWCEVSAFDAEAERWAKHYGKGQVIEVAGKFSLHPYTSQKTGEASVTMRIEGARGATPYVNWVPRSKEEASTAPSNAAAADDDDNIPF